MELCDVARFLSNRGGAGAGGVVVWWCGGMMEVFADSNTNPTNCFYCF